MPRASVGHAITVCPECHETREQEAYELAAVARVELAEAVADYMMRMHVRGTPFTPALLHRALRESSDLLTQLQEAIVGANRSFEAASDVLRNHSFRIPTPSQFEEAFLESTPRTAEESYVHLDGLLEQYRRFTGESNEPNDDEEGNTISTGTTYTVASTTGDGSVPF
jgi:hypothetical protein